MLQADMGSVVGGLLLDLRGMLPFKPLELGTVLSSGDDLFLHFPHRLHLLMKRLPEVTMLQNRRRARVSCHRSRTPEGRVGGALQGR